MSGQSCIWQHISWQGGWGSLVSNATVPTFSHASMRTAIKNMSRMKDSRSVYPVMRHMCWHGHIAQVVVRHLDPQVLSWLAHYLWDAHARIGSVVAENVGSHGADRENEAPIKMCCASNMSLLPSRSESCMDTSCRFISKNRLHCDWPHSLAWRHSHVGHWRHRCVPDQTRSWMSDDWFTNLHIRNGGPSRYLVLKLSLKGAGAPMSMTMQHTFNPHMQRSDWYQKQPSKPRKAYLPHRCCQIKRSAKQAVTCSVLCMVLSRPSWDRRSFLAAPGRCYFCMAYSSSRYPECLDSYASSPDWSNFSKSGTQKSSKGLQVNACCKWHWIAEEDRSTGLREHPYYETSWGLLAPMYEKQKDLRNW